MERDYLDAFAKLDQYDRSKYMKTANLRGCRPFFDTPVLQRFQETVPPLSASGIKRQKIHHEMTELQNQLTKKECLREFETVLPVVRQWVKPNAKVSIWATRTLAVDLNLRMDIKIPGILLSQFLLLAEGKPPVLCSFFDAEESNKKLTDDVKKYTFRMAQHFKATLTNFCSCDFAVLRFVMAADKITFDSFLGAVKNELQFTRTFFRGAVDLTAESYASIKRAVDAMVCGSHVPSLLQQEEEVSILLLDKAWGDGLSLVIEALHEGKIQYPPHADFKLKVAALEAAARHSYNKKVVITSSDEDVQDCAKRLQEQAKADFNPQPNLVVKPGVSNLQSTTICLEPITVEHQAQQDTAVPANPSTRKGEKRVDVKNGEQSSDEMPVKRALRRKMEIVLVKASEVEPYCKRASVR